MVTSLDSLHIGSPSTKLAAATPSAPPNVPLISEDKPKLIYYSGLTEWDHEKGFLTEAYITDQDRFKNHLDHFWIAY